MLEIIPHKVADNHSETAPIYTGTGLPISGDQNNNLCLKAYQLLKKDFPHLPCIKMHLHKIIPMGAGLGGGSADAAFTLILLNQQFNLSLSQNQLLNYAAILGSDCPFFILNKPCFATGRGEILSPITLNLSSYCILLVHPAIHINTKWAFTQLKPSKPPHCLTQLIKAPIETWKHTLINDFEAPIAQAYPVLRTIKTNLYQTGAVYASLSGSGSTIFGIYPKNKLPLKSYFNYPTNQINLD